MPKKNVHRYVCASCGAVATSWTGRCQTCGEWNSLSEEAVTDDLSGDRPGQILNGQPATSLISNDHQRLVSGMPDLDSVLGGGLVAGSVNLLAGSPGVGKSTLALQLAANLSISQPVLYVSGEESGHQIGLRAKRLKAVAENLKLATTTSADDIAATVADGHYRLVVIDSIQTMATALVASSAGSIAQITNSTRLVTAAAKQTDTALIIVGHVTKEGTIAGPKLLEHLVDVVLQLEGDNSSEYKILRAVKNRFGSTTETGIFEMNENGLRAVANPSAALLAERQITDGSVVLATMEGSRPLLVEVQALVNRTAYGYPKRAANGLDLSRVNLLIAVLERRTKLNLSDQDIYVNIVGGLRISEPAADLAVALAIGSAAKGMKLKNNLAVFGEVGLSGEIRHVPSIDKRLSEAKKHGFEGAIGPKTGQTKQIAAYWAMPDVRTALNSFLKPKR